MADYYKEGCREAVVFLFYQEGKILIEHRPREEGGKEIFIPNGGIDGSDLSSGSDYKVAAMKREISEEMGPAISILKFASLGECIVPEIKIRFYGYLILAWSGSIPPYTLEDHKKFADLQWIPIEEYRKYLEFESARFFVAKALDALRRKG